LGYGLAVTQEIYFRAGVGLLVINRSGLVLVAERSDRPKAWQAPQGGLQPGEEPLDAAARELDEETGIRWSDVTVMAELDEWLGYELPPEARSEKTGRGQVQKWFLVRFLGSDQSVHVATGESAEFRRWRWVPLQELVDSAWDVKRPVYRRLVETWSDTIAHDA